MKRNKWQPTASSYICSKHFAENCFRTYSNQLRLKEDAVPSVFDFPSHLQKRRAERRPLVKYDSLQSTEAVLSTSSICDIHAEQSPSVNAMHNYAVMTSPRAVKRKYEDMLQKERMRRSVANKRLKVARRCLFRKKHKLNSMKDIISELKKKKDISVASVELIERCFGHIPAEMLKRKLTLKSRQPYCDDLRSFALTLHFYSPKAYDFVRKSFALTLPHPSTLRLWCSTVNGRPGFTSESFEVF